MRRYNELVRSEIVIVLLYDGGFVYSNHGCIYTVVGKEQEMSNRNAHLPGAPGQPQSIPYQITGQTMPHLRGERKD